MLGSRALRAGTIWSAVVLATGLPLVAQAPEQGPVPPRLSRDVTLDSGSVWTATDVVITPGDRVVFRAAGTARCGDQPAFGPAGLPRGFRDLLRILPLAQAGRGALIGRIGEGDAARPFLIGVSSEVTATGEGPLTIGINRAANDPCDAPFTLDVDVFPALEGAPVATSVRTDALPGVDRTLLSTLPRRIGDKDGNPGDMVNFLILGRQDGVEKVFRAAGWVLVDRDVKGAVLNGAVQSLSKESYLTLPMSQLYLFGRPQDYGWAHAEPIKVAAARHHLRLWKAPTLVDGMTLWAGAATHDIGFERDRRNNGITHKIDPDIDLERDFVEKTLTSTGLVTSYTYVTPDDALREAKTATGGTFHSDGRVLVFQLSDTREPSASTSR